MNNKRSFLKGAVILSVAGGISKVMGGIYRIPLARMIGDEGMALYQMAYPVYTAILALATAGIPVAISVLVAQKAEIAMRNLLITGLFKVIFNYTLTAVPALNIKGAAIATVAAFLIGSFLNMVSLRKITGLVYEGGRILKIGLVTVVMAVMVKLVFQFLVSINFHSHAATLIAIVIGTAVYGILLLVLRELDVKMLKGII